MNRHIGLAVLSASLAVLGTTAILPSQDKVDPRLEKSAEVKVPTKLDIPLKNFTETLPGDVKFEMVYVPAGEFLMGSPDAEKGRKDDEGPQRKVSIKGYWIGKMEVKWEEFDRFVKNEKIIEYPKDEPFPKTSDALSRPTPPFVPEDYGHGHDGYPAICMSHHCAMMYCHWLRTVTKKGYRLPTEAEWEYACRAGNNGPFGCDATKIGDYANYLENTTKDDEHPKGTTALCGSKKANAFGIHDMHGNVAEWVLDEYAADFYKKAPALQPVNKLTDKKWGHIVRGGSFRDPADKLRAAARVFSTHDWMRNDPQSPRSIWWLTKMDHVGFRVALPVEEQKDLIGLKPMVVKKVEHDPVKEEK